MAGDHSGEFICKKDSPMTRRFMCLVLCLFCMLSCNKEESNAGKDIAVKLQISMTDYSDLTFVCGNHIWTEDDRVLVVDAAQKNVRTMTEPLSTGSTDALFICAMPLTGKENLLVGIYPADAPLSYESGNLRFEIPQNQDGSVVPMQAGKTEYTSGSYQGGVIRLAPLYKVLNVWVDRSSRAISKIKVTAADGKMISGTVSLDVGTWEETAMSASVTVIPDKPLDCSTGRQSVAVMVADTDTDGYIAEVTTTDGEVFLTSNVTEGYSTTAEKSYDLGISQALFGSLSSSEAKSVVSAGVKYLEVTMNTFWRGYTEEECYTRARSTKRIIDETDGLEVWSVHLPFSSTLDISVTDDQKRAENVAVMSEMIRLAGEFSPKKLVLHPSSEPISEQDRAARLACSKESIGKLLPLAEEIGAQLCVENLPRTCLGRTSSEILYLIADYPEVMVCFDSNHLLAEDHGHFFSVVGDRIGTIHASDYDRTDERHWLPGQGTIDWPMFLTHLMHYGYDGVFMTEVKSGPTAADVAAAYRDVVCATN